MATLHREYGLWSLKKAVVVVTVVVVVVVVEDDDDDDDDGGGDGGDYYHDDDNSDDEDDGYITSFGIISCDMKRFIACGKIRCNDTFLVWWRLSWFM